MANLVLKGDYEGYQTSILGKKVTLIKLFKKNIELTKDTVESYEEIAEETKTSGSSAVVRGGAGALLLGPIGLAAAFTAKQKGIHTLLVKFKDGKQSVVELDDKQFKLFKMEFL